MELQKGSEILGPAFPGSIEGKGLGLRSADGRRRGVLQTLGRGADAEWPRGMTNIHV